MATTDLMIGIGAEYKGKAAFGKANKDVTGLGKGVKTLAKAYIGLAGAQKAFRFGQQSLKAFVEDDKAARKLTQTVSNLGLAYEATNVSNFIAGLEKTYAVADDLLRPAFAKLIQTTQSVTASQDIMRTALNAAAGAGVNLDTAITDLSQAYVGNLKGLKKYNLGLTNAELATMSFQQIQDKLNQTFTGQAALAAETYAGKMDKLSIASGNAKEIIGKGLTDAITSAFGGGDIDKATTNIESFGQVVADIIAGLGTMIGFLGKIKNLAPQTDKLTNKDFMGAQPNTPYDPMSAFTPGLSPAFMKTIAQRKAADAAAAKRQKELAALAIKQTKAIKEQTALAKAKAVLDKASAVMNMDLIQNTAALMGKVTEDETLRLKLQQAILLGNSTEAGNLAQQLLASQYAAMKLSSTNPLGGFTDALQAALKGVRDLRDELAKLGAPKVGIAAMLTPGQLLAQDALAAEEDARNPDFAGLDARGRPVNGGYSQYDRSLTPTEIRIFMDPMAAAAGVAAAVIDNSANGNSNNYSPIFSWAGGF
jgi:hypothetical protein